MFFVAAKTVGVLLAPSNFLLLLVVAGLVFLLLRRLRTGIAFVAAGAGLLFLIGLTPVAWIPLDLLESRVPPWHDDGRAPDGAVILGGSFNVGISNTRGIAQLNEAADRIVAIMQLRRRYPNIRIVFSGGSGELVRSGAAEADLTRRLLESIGFDPSSVVYEGKSRDTAENARMSKDVAAPRPRERWLLVTSAAHMPRALGAFRKVGFDVEPYPVDWKMMGSEAFGSFPRTLSQGLTLFDAGCREWLGLAAYRISGRTASFLPDFKTPR